MAKLIINNALAAMIAAIPPADMCLAYRIKHETSVGEQYLAFCALYAPTKEEKEPDAIILCLQF
jgi:hypothetical protein